ncbi:MAG: type III secretion system chaperone [Puniceicoccales bacterium]|jgi:hypothetical protein|nr:type III secretion system chaperone [Puniceicoccales bacterium]
MQVFQQWLNQLASEVNLEEPLVLDDKHQCFLMFDETLLVTMEFNAADNVFSFKASLGNVNEWQIKRIYPRLLEANLQWRETYGATLGLQQFSDKVLLVQHTPLLNCDYEIFEKSLECFVNTFEYWVQNLKTLQQSTKENTKEAAVYSNVQA